MKTSPIGVRFSKEILDKLSEKHGISSPQKALNYLEDFWDKANAFEANTIMPIPKEVVKEKWVKQEDIKEDVKEVNHCPITTKAEYKKILDNCMFEVEYKALWERVSQDPNLSDREKREWMAIINAK